MFSFQFWKKIKATFFPRHNPAIASLCWAGTCLKYCILYSLSLFCEVNFLWNTTSCLFWIKCEIWDNTKPLPPLEVSMVFFLKKRWPKVIFSILSSQVDNSQFPGILNLHKAIWLSLETIRVSLFEGVWKNAPERNLSSKKLVY